MPNKLPAYFEKYFDQKFGEVEARFTELKGHVNDEIQIIRITLQKVEAQMNKIWWILALIIVLLFVHEETKINMFDLIKGIFIK